MSPLEALADERCRYSMAASDLENPVIRLDVQLFNCGSESLTHLDTSTKDLSS